MANEEELAAPASSTATGDGTWAADAVGPSVPTGEPEPVEAQDPDAGSRRFWAIVVAVLVLLLLLTLCMLAYCTLRPGAKGQGTGRVAPGTTPTPVAITIRGRADAEEALLALERCRDAVKYGTTLSELRDLSKEAEGKVQAFQGSQDAYDNPNLTNDMVKAADLWLASCQQWGTANAQAVASYNGAYGVWIKAGHPGKTPVVSDYLFTGAYRSMQAQAAGFTDEARWLYGVPRDLDPPLSYSQ